MNIELLYQDKFKFDFEKDLFNKYQVRLRKISGKILGRFSEKKVSGKKMVEIISKKNANNYVILLDEKGEQLKTHQLKDLIFNTQSKTITFMIGGTDGFSEQFLKKGNMVMSLSRMTLTHSFAAIILLEQIYRSVTIKINHPYHRR